MLIKWKSQNKWHGSDYVESKRLNSISIKLNAVTEPLIS